MRKGVLYVGLGLVYVLLCSSSGGGGGTPTPEWEQEHCNFILLNNEIKYTLQENERQKNIKKEQTQNTSLETANRNLWDKYKNKAKDIQNRLRIVDFTLQAIPTGYVIVQKSGDIRRKQQRIFSELQNAPRFIKNVFQSQIHFIDELQMVTRFLAGIVLSYGAINQMEKAERKILIDYALSEVERLDRMSSEVLQTIWLAKENEQRKRAVRDYYIARDKELVQDIFRNIKKL